MSLKIVASSRSAVIGLGRKSNILTFNAWYIYSKYPVKNIKYMDLFAARILSASSSPLMSDFNSISKNITFAEFSFK